MVSILSRDPTIDGLRAGIAEAIASTDKIAKRDEDYVTEGFAAEPIELLQSMIATAKEMWSPPPHPEGDGVVLDSEVPFGKNPAAYMSLGREPIEVSGFIDALVEWKTAEDTPSLGVVDFKTGGEKSGGNVKQVKHWHTKPQLNFYALAVQEGLVEAPSGLKVSKIGYDMVKLCKEKSIPVDEDHLNESLQTYGTLIDLARDGDFVPIAHPEWTPYQGGHQSDIFDALRIRPDGLPDHAEDDEDKS